MTDRPSLTKQAARWYPTGWAHWYAILRTRLYAKRFQKIIEQLPPSGRIVDVGAGYGLLVNLIAGERPQGTLVGIDVDARRIRAAQATVQNRSNLSFQVADARSYDYRPGDTILMVDVLHHIPRSDQATLLERIARAIGDEGLLIIADIDTYPQWKYWLASLSDTVLYPFSTHSQFSSAAKLTEQLQGTGYELLRQQPTNQGSVFSTILYTCRPRSGKNEPR